MKVLRVLVLALLAFAAAASSADVTSPFRVDPALSKLTTTLCVQTQCDSDEEPLQGFLLLSLDCSRPPATAALNDLRLASPSNHNVALDFGFGGRVGAVLSNLVIYHAAPSLHAPAQSVTNGQLVFRNIPSLLSGSIYYNATGLACALIQIAGLGCEGQIDLSQRSTNVIVELRSRLELVGRRAVLTGGFDFKSFISEDDPDLGEVRGRADFTAEADLKPSVAIELGPSTHTLRWCRLFEGFLLQRTASLDQPWQGVDAEPVAESDQWVVSLPNEGAPWFYRLVSQ